jgi:hypothetical protein
MLISSYIRSIERDVFLKNFINAKLNESITDFEHFKRNLTFFKDCCNTEKLIEYLGNYLSDSLNEYKEQFTEDKLKNIITNYEQFREICELLAFDENKQHDSIIKLFSVEDLFKMVKNIHQLMNIYQLLDYIPTKQAAFINQFKNDNYLALCKDPNDIASLNIFLEANRLRKVDANHLSNLDIACNESNQNTTSPNAVFHDQELIASHKLPNDITNQRTDKMASQ